MLAGPLAKNVVAFVFNALIPPYAKWPTLPANRGSADEVQRARLHAKNDMPKVFVLMMKSAAEEHETR